MIRTNEIDHLFKQDSETIKNVYTQKWDDMFNTDNTNAIRQQKERYNTYEDAFRGNHSNLIEDHIDMLARHNEKFNSDNTNNVSERISRDQRFEHAQRGMVQFDQSKPPISYHLYKHDGNVGNTLKHQQEEIPLSKFYFSKDNVERLQNMIRYNVWLRSGKQHIIGRQSDTQLEIIMRSIYLQFSKNLDCYLKEQINELNDLVLEYAVANVLGEINMYQSYRDRISQLPVPLEHAVNLSIKGDRILEQKAFL